MTTRAVDRSAMTVTPHDQLPDLYRDPSFWAMAATQFLGAFNDNLFKQLMLLLRRRRRNGRHVRTGKVRRRSFLPPPFLIFRASRATSPIGYQQAAIVVVCKVAEIGVMALGCHGVLGRTNRSALWPLYAVLFLMGTHSAFFGPAKYGILPEMVRPDDLPRANGFF